MANNSCYSIETEQSVLGGLMLDNSKWVEVSKILTADDFYDPRNKLIFNAILSIANSVKKFDMLIVSEQLKAKEKLEYAGNEAYIFGIAKNTPSAENTIEYARIVKQKSLERKKISIAEGLKKHPENLSSSMEKLKEIELLERESKHYPLPIRFENPKLPKIPEKFLPNWLGEMVDAVATATETPTELSLMVGLAVLATCCQRKFVIEPEKGYIEQLCVWVLVILESGNRKTAVIKLMTQCLLEWEKQKKQELTPEIKKTESIKLTMERKINNLRKKAADAASNEEMYKIQQEIFDQEQSMPKIPKIPRLWAQDVTPEKIGVLMADNNERMSIISAEGGLIDTIAGRYSNNIPNLDVFLQGYSGDAVRVDRTGREPVFMNNPALTLCLCAQPDIFRSLNSKKEFRGRGLLARFLFAIPESMIGNRKLECKPIPELVKNNYRDAINKLLNLNNKEPYVLRFSLEAYKEWKEFALFVERESREGGKFENAKDLAGKLPGVAARLAGLLHCISFADNADFALESNCLISLETMKKALGILAVFVEHSLAAFRLIGLDPEVNDAMQVWKWIKKNELKEFSARDCFNGLRGNSFFKRMDSINAALKFLVECYYIFIEESEGAKVGRPKSPTFFASPHLMEN